VELVSELGRRMTAVTEDTMKSTYLFQRLSVALNGEMRSPSTALLPPSKRRCGHSCLVFNIKPSGIEYWDAKNNMQTYTWQFPPYVVNYRWSRNFTITDATRHMQSIMCIGPLLEFTQRWQSSCQTEGKENNKSDIDNWYLTNASSRVLLVNFLSTFHTSHLLGTGTLVMYAGTDHTALKLSGTEMIQLLCCQTVQR